MIMALSEVSKLAALTLSAYPKKLTLDGFLI